jgi:hypothetical protein
MACLSCKRKLIDVIRTVQLLSDFDNTIYFVYQNSLGAYTFSEIETQGYIQKVEPTNKQKKMLYIKFGVNHYKADGFTFEFYCSLTKTPTELEYNKLIGKQSGNNIQKSSEVVKPKINKRNKSKNI